MAHGVPAIPDDAAVLGEVALLDSVQLGPVRIETAPGTWQAFCDFGGGWDASELAMADPWAETSPVTFYMTHRDVSPTSTSPRLRHRFRGKVQVAGAIGDMLSPLLPKHDARFGLVVYDRCFIRLDIDVP